MAERRVVGSGNLSHKSSSHSFLQNFHLSKVIIHLNQFLTFSLKKNIIKFFQWVSSGGSGISWVSSFHHHIHFMINHNFKIWHHHYIHFYINIYFQDISERNIFFESHSAGKDWKVPFRYWIPVWYSIISLSVFVSSSFSICFSLCLWNFLDYQDYLYCEDGSLFFHVFVCF